MYFPYLRGRQFELLAIRELVENKLIGSKIIPIVEPIKPTSTLLKTLNCFSEEDHHIALIHNPKVGNYKKALDNLKDETLKDKLTNSLHKHEVIPAHILNNNSVSELKYIENKENLIVILNDTDHINNYLNIFNTEKPIYTLTPDESSFRRKIKNSRVLLADRFSKQLRNADYVNIEDESFSEDHLYYRDDNYSGFSDFSIVGAEFSETGFAPYAVVIHIVYFDDQMSLRIKHFVSDTNDDITDPAGKFYEALEKLINWNYSKNIDTLGIREFQKHYKNGTYPGLGTVKKIAIMHHIELINNFLEERLK
ncbi:sce7725 family protein [Gracilibacillus sp. S3-1-1]|uniref:Sce7725 family protein n=1 Tax=Gracilibacillus pellucidus TaxID=3095368 RepID=A0ACC6M6R0_9BACI|nr:sce7725 family protein [Gracilibacillus sp. S3-1-1]MDX8046634.1 sce7725 family protein [Gracilibacillus sp. S3-1-1]